jgi:hypothetical protein
MLRSSLYPVFCPTLCLVFSSVVTAVTSSIATTDPHEDTVLHYFTLGTIVVKPMEYTCGCHIDYVVEVEKVGKTKKQ